MIICAHFGPRVSLCLHSKGAKSGYNRITTQWHFIVLVNGVMKCDFNRHRTCGFDGVDSSAQFMWRISRTGSNEFTLFPSLVATGSSAFLYICVFKYFVWVRGINSIRHKLPCLNYQKMWQEMIKNTASNGFFFLRRLITRTSIFLKNDLRSDLNFHVVQSQTTAVFFCDSFCDAKHTRTCWRLPKIYHKVVYYLQMIHSLHWYFLDRQIFPSYSAY